MSPHGSGGAPSYGYSRTLDLPYQTAVERVRETLKAQGFAVLCEIDIKEKLKEKRRRFSQLRDPGRMQSAAGLPDFAAGAEHWSAASVQRHCL